MELEQSSILFITIYKPPKISFIEDFTELLLVVCADFDCLVIAGDMNVHVDVANDPHHKQLSAVLDIFGLSQHVRQCTHEDGHTLDLIITKGVDISNVSVDVAVSDHYCVFFEMSAIPKHAAVEPTVIRRRLINDQTSEQFMKMISFSRISSDNVDDLLSNFTSSVSYVFDNIAPVKVRMVKDRQKAPWRKEVSVRAQKNECRRAERKWRKSKLREDYKKYREQLGLFNMTLRRARESYFSEIITNCSNNSRVLFATVNRLTNPPHSLPPELNSTSKCNEFAKFFIDKIETIKNDIVSTTQTTALQPSQLPGFTNFTPVTDKTVQEFISDLSSCTSCLDELPTRFLKSVLSSLLPQITQIVNISLQTGTFPRALKAAVIKHLFKKE